MTNGDPTAWMRHLRRMLAAPCAGELTDAELLERFVAGRDEAAFEVLVWRHGPKVLGLCRRVLRHEQNAEDAFQATFLVLVRKAGSISRRQALASWLYRVAYHIALRAKTRADKRAARDTALADVAVAVRPDSIGDDLRPALDEEVSRLPEKYRAPFILCYLDGKTNEEAARELGCPKGTVQSRLAWARQRLRTRLTRRGLALSGGLPGAWMPESGPAVVPALLVDATRRAALQVAAGKPVAAVVSGPVTALTTGVLRTMLWTKILILVGCVLAGGTLVVGAGMARQALGANETPGMAAEAPQAASQKPEKPAHRAEAPPPKEQTFAIEIRDKPWSNVFEWYSDISGLPFVSNSKPPGTFTFIPPGPKQRYTLTQITDFLNEALLAQKYVLVRREASFTVLPADEKIDPTLLPRVRLEDLGKRGRTELVTVVIPLKNLSATDFGPEVKKMVGPFGEVIVLEKANQLIVQDTAGNLRHICEILKEVEAEKKPAGKN
jgi:RNA polymerase sigma factor (sigma-70 family)